MTAGHLARPALFEAKLCSTQAGPGRHMTAHNIAIKMWPQALCVSAPHNTHFCRIRPTLAFIYRFQVDSYIHFWWGLQKGLCIGKF